MDKLQGFLDAKINLLDITGVFPRNYVTIHVMLHRQITRFSRWQDKPSRHLPRFVLEITSRSTSCYIDKLQGFLDAKINLLDITAVFPRNYVTINVMLHRQITRFSR